MTWMDVVDTLVSKNAQASELQAETNTLSETLLQLLQAPAGVLLWRKSLLVSGVTINRMESLSFFLQETVLQEGASLSASAHTHTNTLRRWSFCRAVCDFVIYVRVPTLSCRVFLYLSCQVHLSEHHTEDLSCLPAHILQSCPCSFVF